MAFVHGSGTATLSLTSSLKSPQGHLIKADDRDSKKDENEYNVQKVLVKMSWTVFFLHVFFKASPEEEKENRQWWIK